MSFPSASLQSELDKPTISTRGASKNNAEMGGLPSRHQKVIPSGDVRFANGGLGYERWKARLHLN